MKKVSSLEEIYDFINYWDKERKNLPVATDGIVLKVNSLRQQRLLDILPSLHVGQLPISLRLNELVQDLMRSHTKLVELVL